MQGKRHRHQAQGKPDQEGGHEQGSDFAMAIHVTTPGATVNAVTAPGRRDCRTVRTIATALVAVVTIATLAGCGGGSTASGSTSAKAPYTDVEACTWVKENLPTIPDTEIGAQAQLTIGLSAFFEDHGGLQNADGYALDDALARGCPDVHAAALKKAGIKSFGNL
jgi:hypothetical protein